MFCGKCGSQINDGAVFCPNCGNSLSDQSSAQAATKKTVAVKVRAQNTVGEQITDSLPMNTSRQTYGQPMNANPIDAQQMYGQPTNSYSMGGQPTYSQPINGYQTGGFPSDAPKKKSKAPVVVAVILIVLILAAAGIGAYYFLYADNGKDGGDEKESVSRQLKTSNSNAKMAYNIVAEYMADMETQGIPYKETMSEISRYYDVTEDGDGLQQKFYSQFKEGGIDEGWVYIGSAEINGNQSFFVQYWEDDDSEVIGQYPDAISKDNVGSVEYGKYFAP